MPFVSLSTYYFIYGIKGMRKLTWEIQMDIWNGIKRVEGLRGAREG